MFIDFSPEFKFQTSRSRGAGGQNVNKVESRVELIFDVNNSTLLDEAQKDKIRTKLVNKIDNEGLLHITAEASRSQLKNKELAVEKFYILLEKALTEQKPRKPSKPSRAAKEKRLQAKRINSLKKQERGRRED
jgi:ribosome-associated protein